LQETPMRPKPKSACLAGSHSAGLSAPRRDGRTTRNTWNFLKSVRQSAD
jgi:hypothetical protein